jgi:RNA recognition motif-containing protein
MKREFREHFLRLKTLRFKRTMARHNLYFRGFPVGEDMEGLKQQLTEYFGQFGEVNNLHLMTRKKDDQSTDLVGFGFVSFKSLEGAQTAKYQAQNVLFHGRKLYINQFETKEQRIASFNERVDILEFQRHLKYLENKRAMEKLESVSSELQTEQG